MRPSKIASVAQAAIFIAYPVAAYFAFTHLPVRWAAGALLVLFVPAVISRLGGKARRALAPLVLAPIVTLILLAAAAVLDVAALALLVPVGVSAALLATFASTLVWGPPIIERFARLAVDDLSEAELRWCRGWTWGWSAFFICNGSIALATALWSTLEVWTAYNSIIAYVLMGSMFGVEYSVRKFRFGRLGTHVLDRVLVRTFAAFGHSPGEER